MELPPATPAAATMFRGSPLACPDDGQTRAVEHEMEALAGRDQPQTAPQMLTAPGEHGHRQVSMATTPGSAVPIFMPGRRTAAPPTGRSCESPRRRTGRPDYVVFRQELTTEERSRCGDTTHTDQHIWPHAGVALGVPVGERLFFRASARMVLFQVEFGVGVKF